VEWTCRLLENNDDFAEATQLEKRVWQLEDQEVLPISLLHAMVKGESFLAGAYNQERMVGMAFGFPARKNGEWILWSHVTGVDPAFQGHGVGSALKLFQRTWAIKHGYRTISWTFDPLQSKNARFNLHVLGATADRYHVNFYGKMTDALNAGLPSDRLEVNWKVGRKSAERESTQDIIETHTLIPDDEKLLSFSEKGFPVLNASHSFQRKIFVAIPENINHLKKTDRQLAFEWRIALREALQVGFANGFKAESVVSNSEGSWYVLTKPSPWHLYVLECADKTLYTGISPDVQKRIHRHNQGRGAAYTAARLPVKLVANWAFVDRSIATKAELRFKRLTRDQKLSHIRSQSPFEGAPFIDLD
jgi:predicted GNAT superfamily acetyltransferase